MRFRFLLPALALAAALAPGALASMHPEVAARLTGKVEVPRGAPAGRGIVNVTLDGAKGRVCWTFEGIAGIGKPLAAHIHKAPAGKAGPIVVPFGGAYRAKGCTTAAKALVAAIEAKPGAYYVNVHTAKFPAGAIRGQLVAGMVHL
jgi:CHRD domain